MDVCVCLSGADGRVVEGRATLFRHHREVSRVQSPWMFVLYFVLCCPERKKKKRVCVGGRGKYPGAPPHIREKKERKKNKPTARYLIDQYGERGKATIKKKKLIS
jgi:hypothetical protein